MYSDLLPFLLLAFAPCPVDPPAAGDPSTSSLILGLAPGAALEEGLDVEEILKEGLIAGMGVVGEDFKRNRLYTRYSSRCEHRIKDRPA